MVKHESGHGPMQAAVAAAQADEQMNKRTHNDDQTFL